MTVEEFRDRIRALLDQPYPYSGWHCDRCGVSIGHPLVYCIHCPGRYVRTNRTWKEQLEQGMSDFAVARLAHAVIYGELTHKGQRLAEDAYEANREDFVRIVRELLEEQKEG